jgi:hypothetical protein
MNHAAIATKIQRSIECARGVPESTSGRRSFKEILPATVAMALPPRLRTGFKTYHNLRTRGSPDFVSPSSVTAHTIASARSGDRPGPS